MKNAGKACNNRLYRHIRTFEKIVKNYFVIYYKFINIILATMGMSSMAASIGLTLAFVAVIYGGYFLITYLCSRSIIRPVR